MHEGLPKSEGTLATQIENSLHEKTNSSPSATTLMSLLLSYCLFGCAVVFQGGVDTEGRDMLFHKYFL